MFRRVIKHIFCLPLLLLTGVAFAQQDPQVTQLRGDGRQFRDIRQFAPVQQVHDFLESAVSDKVVNIVADVAEFSVGPVHFAETAFICDNSFESFGDHGHDVCEGGECASSLSAPGGVLKWILADAAKNNALIFPVPLW